MITKEEYANTYGRWIEDTEIVIEDLEEEQLFQIAEEMAKKGYNLEYWKAPKQESGHLHIKDIIFPKTLNSEEIKLYKTLVLKKYVPEALHSKVDWNLVGKHRIAKENEEHYKGYGIKSLYKVWNGNNKNYAEEDLFKNLDIKISKTDVSDYQNIIDEVLPIWKEGDRQNKALALAGYLRKNKRLGIEKVKQIITKVCELSGDNELNQRLNAVETTFKKDEAEIKGISGLLDTKLSLELIDGKKVEQEVKNKPNKKFEGLDIFNRKSQAETFYDEQPFFYDKSNIWWFWDKEEYRYVMTDEVEILNSLEAVLPVDIITSKNRGEILNSLKQYGRNKKPKDMPPHWLQFKNQIVDVKSGDIFEASPIYFTANPIPWEIGAETSTPTIDKIFKEWVVGGGQDDSYVKTLYEIIAYASTNDQFLQRLIALCGSGSNGKGTFINLLIKFLGGYNICTSELKLLANNSFEASALYKKLVCFMTEVDSYDMKNTNLIKKLSGEDVLRFEFKGKTSFTDKSGTTCIIATNSLPVTNDKSLGFYRRWLIVDFPNQFSVKSDLLGSIPEVEFKNLAKKVIETLKGLYKNQSFTNEGSIEDRIRKYEDRSNPLQRFIEERCIEDPEKVTILQYFCKEFNDFLNKNRLRLMKTNIIAKALRNEGFEVKGRRTIGSDGQETHTTCVFGLKINQSQPLTTTQNHSNLKLVPIETDLKNEWSPMVSNGSKDDFSEETAKNNKTYNKEFEEAAIFGRDGSVGSLLQRKEQNKNSFIELAEISTNTTKTTKLEEEPEDFSENLDFLTKTIKPHNKEFEKLMEDIDEDVN